MISNYQVDRGGYEGLARVTAKGGSMVRQQSGLKIENADEVLVLIRITPLGHPQEGRRADRLTRPAAGYWTSR